MRYKTLSGLTAAFCVILCGNTIADDTMNADLPRESTNPAGLEIIQAPLTDMGNRLYGWQGFDHEWLRFVILRDLGRVPHRLSRFHNYIDMPGEQFNFAQSTGVDGNYMRPKGYYATVESPSLQVQQGSVAMNWTDQTTDNSYPVATNSIRYQIPVPLDQLANSHNAHVNLQGIKLDLQCDDDKQPASRPCNSDGMWPYFFRIELGECLSDQNTLYCDVIVDIDRGWTPNKGGIQLFPLINEIKPLNDRLDYELELFYSVVSARSDDLMAQPTEKYSMKGILQQKESYSGTVQHSVVPDTFHTSVTLIKGFSFTLSAPDTIQPYWTMLGSDTGHRGRYISKLNFSVRDIDHDPEDGKYSFEYRMGVWSPISVVDSALETTLKTQTLLLAEQPIKTPSKQATGRLCINSTDQVLPITRWELCDLTHWLARWIYGGKERPTNAIDIGD